MRIGILGGSFNPAHEGHLHISRLAIKRLRLDALWWMVSPQNPLKPQAGMASLAKRMATARDMARDPRIHVTDIETQLHTRYTIHTLRALKARFPHARFVWIMGADNLQQFPDWRDWASIFHTVPIAVFDRATYSFKALSSKAAHRFGRHRIMAHNAAALPCLAPPAWAYFHTPRHPASATEIRAAYDDADKERHD
ncbi:MAG: nicotinate-nucleotide adenylyltransferase [Alphaproteobacteria bacterium]